MNGNLVSVRVGAQVLFDGDVVRVVEFDGVGVTVREERSGRFRTLTLARFVAGCAATEAPEETLAAGSVGTTLAGLTRAQVEQVAARAGHVRDVLIEDGSPLRDRLRVKAAELGLAVRTVQRWVAAYRRDGEAGLVDTRVICGLGSRVDPRWDDAVRAVMAAKVNASTPTRSALLAAVSALLDERHGAGVVPRPSRATAYRRLAELAKGTNAVAGSAKGRRSIADRPQGAYGRLRATRPGEYVVLDTQDLDVFAMEPVTSRWVRAQLTVALDLFTRCVVGLRVTAVSTKAVDVAGVLYESVAGRPAPMSWPGDGAWPYHGVPQNLVFDEGMPAGDGPVCAPETLVVDHGKVFLSAHVIAVCTRLGISIQPAQPHKPTDKPTVERFFRTLREGLTQHLPAYKGPDIHARGERVEDEAFLFLHEMEDVIREWIATVYHRAKHDGLVVAEWPHLQLSPAEMFAVGVGKAGLLRIPAAPGLALDFLPVVVRTIQHYGVEVHGLRYNGSALDGYRNARSPYGGVLAGKWPVRVNPDDVRHAWFQDPADQRWHRLDWEHGPLLDTPFSAEAAAHARRLAVAGDGGFEPAKAMVELLHRWDAGLVTDRRERRMAVRLSAEYAALPAADPPVPAPRAAPACAVFADSDDDDGDLDDGFYDDAFEVLS
ncbi:Mu transposase C-terminal domain-containing protein [Micromonospora inyonensis]|uniref:Helix-turn-helix domain-containing protein n=1 Tax=Micromonospora inyonensis TaxID=47866 RepID=A0A1C6RKP6_9ACTN|nr:Mu transposase C-terminal domain-containing protein [Micromonospora inyonensis]SCL17757.1 Helix-turn-helix domain-containing protein [Micromonospora inyonensis]